MTWRVHGVLPEHGLACVYGASASGKSFLSIDLAAAIATGSEWFGYRVKPAPVVYACLEGEGGFKLRVLAWERANGRPLPRDMRVMLQTFKLADPHDVKELAEAVRDVGPSTVIIIDTLNRAAPSADENSSRDMGEILEAAKALQRATNGLVVLVHHSGKDATKGLRGHSSLFAALDAAIEVTRDGDRREWRIAKAKDGKDGEGHPFHLEVVALGSDGDEESSSSCVVRAEDSAGSATRPRLPKGVNQRVALSALYEELKKTGSFGMCGAPAQAPCVDVEATVEIIAARLLCDPKRKKERARHALNGLVSASVVTCRDGWLWLT
jgi:putative DNA primase/helicase